mgnify:CR=1 FL=1
MLLIATRLLQVSSGWVGCHAIRAGHVIELIVPLRFKIVVIQSAHWLLVYLAHELVDFTRWTSLEIRLISHLMTLVFLAIATSLLQSWVVKDTCH